MLVLKEAGLQVAVLTGDGRNTRLVTIDVLTGAVFLPDGNIAPCIEKWRVGVYQADKRVDWLLEFPRTATTS